MAASTLAEPTVLAAAKQHLLPADRPAQYAVTDTQFATDQWRVDEPIDDHIRDILAPYNRVAVGSGYPDMVATTPLTDDLVVNPTTHNDLPLVAVEAKGYAGGNVDIDRGLSQAHDRLSEANVAYLAAPAPGIDAAAKRQAQALNVGLVGVHAVDTAEIIQSPRVVGTGGPDIGETIRFQATAQGVADQSFGLNHPKNYIAYPLAVAHDRPTESVMAEYVVGAVDDARRGAVFLGLINETPRGPKVTSLGQEVTRYAIDLDGDLTTALSRFVDWQRSRKRFVDIAGPWGGIVRWIVYAYPATERLVDVLQSLHHQGIETPSLRQFVLELYDRYPTFAVELFIRGTDTARERVFASETTLDQAALADGTVYASPTVFQLKAMLFHAGIVADRGKEPHRLDPTEDIWALRQPEI